MGWRSRWLSSSSAMVVGVLCDRRCRCLWRHCRSEGVSVYATEALSAYSSTSTISSTDCDSSSDMTEGLAEMMTGALADRADFFSRPPFEPRLPPEATL